MEYEGRDIRLIDADAEIERLQKWIKMTEKEIVHFDDENDDYKIIGYLMDQRNMFLDEIRKLQSYSTAYDLDILLDGLNEILKDEISQPIADCVYECVQQGCW